MITHFLSQTSLVKILKNHKLTRVTKVGNLILKYKLIQLKVKILLFLKIIKIIFKKILLIFYPIKNLSKV